MKKICTLLASSTLALGVAGCNEGNTGQASQIKNQNDVSQIIANVKARRAYFSSDDNYEKAFKQKFGSENSPLDGMVPGTAWSSDAEHIAPNICFNTSQVIRDGATATLSSQYLLDQSKLTDFLNLSSSIKGGWGSFGVNATMNYIKETNSNSLAVSYNFVEKISRKVNIKYPLSAHKLLNDDGKDAYDDGDNPKFRLFCGDRLISSYSEGAFVIANIQVELADKFQKQQFDAHIGANFGGFSDLSMDIKTLKTQYNLHGKVIISAFQLGGDPTQLSKIMPTTMSCNFDDMAACDKLYNTGLSDYLKNSLPNQFTKDSSFTPIGDVQLSPMLLDDDYDMELAKSYVTSDVKVARADLITLAEQNNANYQALSAVVNNYPVPLDVSFKTKVVSAQTIAHDNVTKLQGAVDCWSAPNRCVKTSDVIKSSIVQQSDKQVINSFHGGLSYQAKIGPHTFFASFIPNDTTLKKVELVKGIVVTNDYYYPTSGNGIYSSTINGTAHDGGGRKDGDYLIYLENNQWVMKWTYYCGPQSPGCKDSTDYRIMTKVDNNIASLYNSILY